MLISRSQTKPIPLVLPRITNESMTIARPKNREECIVNFSSIIETANKKEITLTEAMKDIAKEHKVNECIAVVHQAMFYENTEYRDAVLESINDIKMQYVNAGTDFQLDKVLEDVVEMDLAAEDTYMTEILTEGVLSWTSSQLQGLNKLGNDAKDSYNQAKNDVLGYIGSKLTSGLMKGAQDYLSDPERKKKFISNMSDTANKVVGNTIDKAAGTTKDKLKPYVRGAKFGAGVVAVLGGMGAMFNSLTSQDNINNANPGVATRMINSLNKMLNILTGKAQTAPPQQQGIISKIIAKIKWAIQALGRKVGLVK